MQSKCTAQGPCTPQDLYEEKNEKYKLVAGPESNGLKKYCAFCNEDLEGLLDDIEDVEVLDQMLN